MMKILKQTKRIATVVITGLLLFSCDSDDAQETFNLDNLQGKWYRANSNNPNADGMELTVAGNKAIVTNPANSAFPMNTIKWKDIIAIAQNKFEYNDLNSDGAYYDAMMELGTDDTLRISIGYGGLGNHQKWVRTFTAPELNECTPYDPESGAIVISDTWSEPNEVDFYPGFLPAMSDRAGGYFIVTLSSSGSLPWIDIRSPGTEIPIINGAGPSDETVVKVAISAQPGLSYDVFVKPFINGENFPETYTLSWEYHGIMDCYEANDTFDQAKFIPKNQSIEAMANRNNEGSISTQEKFKDFYKVILTEPAKIQVELEESPSDNFVELKIYNHNQTHLPSNISPINGNAQTAEVGSLYKISSQSVLDPGIYYIEAYGYWSANMTAVKLSDGYSLLDTWLTPYKLKVTTLQ
ncbi:MAG: hypothetical protein Q4G27_07485 [Flavobacteriaceae bacterium]|nr:hypothetical protein [Flavobacteriaceae bacterium]